MNICNILYADCNIKSYIAKLGLAIGLSLFSIAPVYAIDAACTQTTNLSIFRCPENSTDWYDSYTGIVDRLDALARTVPSSFTVRGSTFAIQINGAGTTNLLLVTAGTGVSVSTQITSRSSMTVTADASFATVSGSVGIGTASPASRLDVAAGGNGSTFRDQVTIAGSSLTANGAVRIRAANGNQLLLNNAGEQFTQITFANNGVQKGAIYLDDTPKVLQFDASSDYDKHVFSIDAVDRFRIFPAANGGVGTDLPFTVSGSSLTIDGAILASRSTFTVTVNPGGANLIDVRAQLGVNISTQVTVTSSITVIGAGGIAFPEQSFTASRAEHGNVVNFSDNGMTIQANNDSTARDFTVMDPDGNFRYIEVTNAGHVVLQGLPEAGGNVGIGTVSPATKLHLSTGTLLVDGNAATPLIRINAGDNNSARIRMVNDATGRDWSIIAGVSELSNNDFSIFDNTAASTRFAIRNSGDVGIGDASADAKLEILSNVGETGYALAVSSQNDVTGNILSVRGNGFVGVGTASPATKLHLSSGTLTVDGNIATALIINPTASVPATATAVIVGSMTITNGAFTPTIKTKAQIDVITPAVGNTYYCSDCTNIYDICVATAATLSGFRAMKGSGGCGSGN